jgi:hypothetical protein
MFIISPSGKTGSPLVRLCQCPTVPFWVEQIVDKAQWLTILKLCHISLEFRLEAALLNSFDMISILLPVLSSTPNLWP